MKLDWGLGSGPETTQELADELEREKRLGVSAYTDSTGLRCLWGFIGGWRHTFGDERRRLRPTSERSLWGMGLSTSDNDAFLGTPEERCREMVRRLRAIP